MKIQANDITFSSRAHLERTATETLYTLDRNGDVLHKDQNKQIEQEEKTAFARYQTGADYTVAIQDKAQHKTAQLIEKNMDTSLDLDDNLEKNMYLHSVLTWAADTIDTLVASFEKNHMAQKQPSSRRHTGDTAGDMLSFAFNGDGLMTQQVELYKSVAAEFREKAQSLLPADASANRIRRTTHTEKEHTVVQAAGVIQTADGREINFSLDVNMQRSEKSEIIEAFRVVDPLVINFSGYAAQLNNEKIAFDLNSDGREESMAKLGSGSGYLALDLNEDGEINNGRELFGPSSGNGFQELALYDSDSNNWIDANDPIYEKLAVWMQDDSEQVAIKKLSEAGIGAIFLGSVDSDFIMKNEADETVGQVTSTGVAVMEEGEVRTVQQIHVVV